MALSRMVLLMQYQDRDGVDNAEYSDTLYKGVC